MKLLPCPFCGGVETTIGADRKTYSYKCRVICTDCGASSGEISVYSEDEQIQAREAHIVWNTRPDQKGEKK